MAKYKKKGYVLAVVMIFAFVLALTMTTIFAVCYRYQYVARKKIEELREEVKSSDSASKISNDDLAVVFAEKSTEIDNAVWQIQLWQSAVLL